MSDTRWNSWQVRVIGVIAPLVLGVVIQRSDLMGLVAALCVLALAIWISVRPARNSGRRPPSLGVQSFGPMMAILLLLGLMIYVSSPRAGIHAQATDSRFDHALILERGRPVAFGTRLNPDGSFHVPRLREGMHYVFLWGTTKDSIYMAEYEVYPNTPQTPVMLSGKGCRAMPKEVARIIYYDNDAYDPKGTRGGPRILRSVALSLDSSFEYFLLVEGHCSDIGTDKYNQALGNRRCLAARDWLVREEHVEVDRFLLVSFSFRDLARTGGTPKDDAENRRVQITKIPALPVLQQFLRAAS